MRSNKSRRPSLLSSLLWYLPVLALILVAVFLAHPLVLILLLLANALAMAATCHAIGFDPEPAYQRTVLRRGAAWLVLFTAYTALVWLLVALPTVSLTTTPSLAGVLMLSAALTIALAFLWRAWPAFGLIYLWDDAFPDTGKGSWIFTAVTRSLTFARHMAAEERFFTHFLPAALATLVLSLGALSLSGLYDVLPTELRTASLWLYGLVVMPVCCLVIANRTLRALLIERGERKPTPTRHAGAMRERPRGLTETPQLSPQEISPGVRDQALLTAVRAGDVGHATALLEAAANPDTLPEQDDSDQRSLLAHAALQPDTHLLRTLIGHGANVNLSHHGMSALLTAARDGCMSRTEAVVILLANGADITATDAEGNTALHYIARSNDLSVAADLVDAGSAMDVTNQRGQSALAIACHAGNWPMAQWLSEHGAQAHVTGSEPALVAAAGTAEDDTTGVAQLLAHKAKANATDALGRNALMTAALEGHADIAQCLLNARADVNASDRHGTTALMEAARTGSNDIVQALCHAGADITLRDRHGRDALALACLSPRANTATAAALVAAGADPYATDDKGRSAVDCVRDAGRWDFLAVLDPDSELPASIAATQTPDPSADSPEHLLDALRYEHWAIAASFTSLVPQWPQSERARLYLELASSGHDRARQWLQQQHGLLVDARLADGRRLLGALVDALPDSIEAVSERMAAGVSPAGAGLLATTMQRLAIHAQAGVPLVRAMLEAGADPFGPLADGRTPLHLATAPGWQPILDTLIASGYDVNVRDHDGCTPLHAAMEHTDDATVRALIAAGADPETSNANGETPLGLAMTTGQPERVRWLRWTPWMLPLRRLRGHDLPAAAAVGDVEATRKLLELGLDVDSRDAQGANALIQACGHGHRDVAACLLDNGADPALTTPSGVTPLVAAINARKLELMTLLLERGTEVDQRLSGNITALMVASAKGHAEAAKLLIDAGADINATDAHGCTALHAAARDAFASNDSLRARRLLDHLLTHAGDVNQVDAQGLTPLLLLVGAHAHPGATCDATHLGALLPVLLDAGARHDHADPRGVTALHACAMHALLAPARILLARGADRTAVDTLGRRSTDLACQLGYVDMAMELDERHAGIPGVRQTLRTPARPAD